MVWVDLIQLTVLIKKFLFELNMSCYETIGAKFDVVYLHEVLLIDVFYEPLKNLDVAVDRYVDILRLAFVIKMLFKVAHVALDELLVAFKVLTYVSIFVKYVYYDHFVVLLISLVVGVNGIHNLFLEEKLAQIGLRLCF